MYIATKDRLFTLYIAIVHRVKLCVTKMHQTLKRRYEGSSIEDIRKSGGGSGVSRGGGRWGRSAPDDTSRGEFQLFFRL